MFPTLMRKISRMLNSALSTPWTCIPISGVLHIMWLSYGGNNTDMMVDFFLLRNLEPLSTVKANHLLGCSINNKVVSYKYQNFT